VNSTKAAAATSPPGNAPGAPDVTGAPGAPRRGRPRSEAAGQAIVDAVLRLLDGGTSLSGMSVEGIAAEAGVGKATIYRRWPNKDALLLDVLVRTDLAEPEYVAGTVRDTLVEILEFFRHSALARRERASVASFVEQFRAVPELHRRYHEEVIAPRRARLRRLLAKGVADGEIRGDVDLDLLGEILVGPMLSRTLLHPDAALDDPTLSATIVDTLLQGIAPVTSGT
jgi:AcrR family transcriptional regulator